ncbi:MAG: hypothetical protein HYS58_00760 [Elusimicrobia bacterium]|nr:hypothetical protein [Elusimicrobiota bacterium]
MALILADRFLKVGFWFLVLFVAPVAITWSPGIIVMRPWYDFDANFFAFAALLFLVQGVAGEKKWPFLIAGMACGLSILSKQNIGSGAWLSGMILIAIQTHLGKSRWRYLSLFVAGVGAVAVLFACYLVSQNAFLQGVDWIFFKAYHRAGQSYLTQALDVILRPDNNFLKLAFLLYAVALILCRKLEKERFAEGRLKFGVVLYAFLTVWFGCLAEKGNDYPQQQIYLSALLAILFGFFSGKNLLELVRKPAFLLLTGISFILIVWPVHINWRLPFKFHVLKWTPDHPKLKGLYFQYSDYRFVRDLIDFEKKISKEEKIFLWPDPIFFYFATDRVPPVPQSGFVISDWESPQDQANQIGDILTRENVKWVIVGQETYFDFGFLRFGTNESWKSAVQKGIAMSTRGDFRVLRDYLNKHYEEVPGPAGYWTLKRL